MSLKNSATAVRPVAVTGTLLAAAGVVSFSFSFPATVWALTGFGPWSTTTVRGAAAALIAAACLAAARVPVPERRHWPGLLVVAGGCVVAFPLMSALALETTSSSHAAVVIGALPLATAATAAAFSGSRPSRTFWAAALAGAAVIVGFTLLRSSGIPTAADLYLFGALFLCAAGYAEGGRLAASMPGWQVIAWALVASAPVMVTAAAFSLAAEPVQLTRQAVLGLAYITAVSQFGGFVLWYRGMAGIGVVRASQLQLAQPLLTLVWSALLLGEHIGPDAPVAALAVLACIAVTQRARS